MSFCSDSSRTTLVGSEHASTKQLLFGEIDTASKQSLRTNITICNLPLTANLAFLKFWLQEDLRDRFLSFCSPEQLAALRLVCLDFGNRSAPFLFRELNVKFRAATFTKPSRVAALERIGHHVEALAFNFPQTSQTLLPPIIDRETGEEREFLYVPQVRAASNSVDSNSHPKYGSLELADLLIKQYPPLFHAATNVPAFTAALSSLPNLKHLKITCPTPADVIPSKRTIVDYALISLRIAVENANLEKLEELSFLPIHASGLFYLQPLLGVGANPRAAKRWSQIRKITIKVSRLEADSMKRTEQLKMLQSYLRCFATHLTSLTFRWEDAKGPPPISLSSDPCFDTSRRQVHFERPVTPPKDLIFKAIKQMRISNVKFDAAQISAFIITHRRTLVELDLQEIHLTRGTWDEALAPLSKLSGSNRRKRRQKLEESMEVPFFFGSPETKYVPHVPILSPVTPVEQAAPRQPLSLYTWLAHRSERVVARGKGHIMSGSEHMRRLLRSSMIPRRHDL